MVLSQELALTLISVITTSGCGAIVYQTCDLMPCAVHYAPLQPNDNPVQIRKAVTRDEFAKIENSITVVMIEDPARIKSNDGITPISSTKIRADGWEPKGVLSMSPGGCLSVDYSLYRWKAYSLGFDGVAVDRRLKATCNARALSRSK